MRPLIRDDMIRVDGLIKTENIIAGALSTFSIHATAVSSKNIYNGDVFAYIEREVEYGIKEKYKPQWEPIHAAFNSTMPIPHRTIANRISRSPQDRKFRRQSSGPFPFAGRKIKT